MDSKARSQLIDATTSVLASLIFHQELNADLRNKVSQPLSYILNTSDQLPAELLQRVGVPAGLPVIFCPVGDFADQKRDMMDTFSHIIEVSQQPKATINGILTRLAMPTEYEREKKRKEMVEITASKLFELVLNHYMVGTWPRVRSVAEKHSNDTFGLVFVGNEN